MDFLVVLMSSILSFTLCSLLSKLKKVPSFLFFVFVSLVLSVFCVCVFVGWIRSSLFQVLIGWFGIWMGMVCLWHWLLILQGLILSPKSLIMKVCNTFYEMFTQLRKILYFLLYKKKLNLLVFKVLIYRLKNIKKLYNYFLFIFYFMMF